MVSVVCQIGLVYDVFGAIRQGYVERVFCFLVYCIPKETVAGGWPAVFFLHLCAKWLQPAALGGFFQQA